MNKLKTPEYVHEPDFSKRPTATKSLGQNFLKNLATANQIVAAAEPLAGFTVLEVGPGLGMLTQALLASEATQVIAIEKDQRMLPYLLHLQRRYPEKLQIILGDAAQIKPQLPAKTKLVANLPYNVATKLILQWLQELSSYTSLTITIQKEVADRFLAAPKSKAYGSLSVLAQWLCRVEDKLTLDPEMFTPEPKVTSKVITLTPRTNPDSAPDFASLSKILQVCFRSRRKVLRKALNELFGASAERIAAELKIRPTSRAEELTVASWCRLAGLYRQLPSRTLEVR